MKKLQIGDVTLSPGINYISAVVLTFQEDLRFVRDQSWEHRVPKNTFPKLLFFRKIGSLVSDLHKLLKNSVKIILRRKNMQRSNLKRGRVGCVFPHRRLIQSINLSPLLDRFSLSASTLLIAIPIQMEERSSCYNVPKTTTVPV